LPAALSTGLILSSWLKKVHCISVVYGVLAVIWQCLICVLRGSAEFLLRKQGVKEKLSPDNESAQGELAGEISPQWKNRQGTSPCRALDQSFVIPAAPHTGLSWGGDDLFV
jgi:hypothetical protein